MRYALQIDKIVLFFILLLAVIPFAQVFHFNIGVAILTSYELIYLLLGFLLALKLVLTMKGYYSSHFLFFSSVLIVWSLLSLITRKVSLFDVINQIRIYLPFIIATLLLFAGTSIKLEKYANRLTIASMLSASSALLIHHFASGFIEQAFAVSEEVIAITVIHGRLFWANALVPFIVLSFFFIKPIKISIPKSMWILAFIVIFTTVFNTLNRTIILGVLLLFLGIVLLQQGRRIRNALTIFCFISIAWGIMLFAFSIDPRIQHLFELRYLGRGYGMSVVFEEAVISSRLLLYEEYFYRISNNFVFGQGLGTPFATVAGIGVYNVDISVLAFVLPFGILGLIIFIAFIWRLFKLALGSHYDISSVRMCIVLLLVSLTMSLNIDLFSRNNFVIFLTYFLLTLHNVTLEQSKVMKEVTI